MSTPAIGPNHRHGQQLSCQPGQLQKPHCALSVQKWPPLLRGPTHQKKPRHTWTQALALSPESAGPGWTCRQLLEKQGDHRGLPAATNTAKRMPSALFLAARGWRTVGESGSANRAWQCRTAQAQRPTIDYVDALARLVAARRCGGIVSTYAWIICAKSLHLVVATRWLDLNAQALQTTTEAALLPPEVNQAPAKATTPLRRYPLRGSGGFEAGTHFWQCPGCQTHSYNPGASTICEARSAAHQRQHAQRGKTARPPHAPHGWAPCV